MTSMQFQTTASPIIIRPRTSHKAAQKPFRRLGNGEKMYPETIRRRIVQARVDRAFRREYAALEREEILAAIAERKVKQHFQKCMAEAYADTMVAVKTVRGTLVVLAFFDSDAIKDTEVFHVEEGRAFRKRESRAQRYSFEEMRDKGWSFETMKEAQYRPIMELLASA